MIRANTPTTPKRKPRKPDPVTDERPLSEVFFSMSDDQKEDLVRRQLDDSAAGRFTTPSAEEQARHDEVPSGVRRGGKGKTYRRVTVSVEQGLLARLDSIAERHGISRARVVQSAILDLVVGLEQRRGRGRSKSQKSDR
jgi:predicted transcriptional regulator